MVKIRSKCSNWRGHFIVVFFVVVDGVVVAKSSGCTPKDSGQRRFETFYIGAAVEGGLSAQSLQQCSCVCVCVCGSSSHLSYSHFFVTCHMAAHRRTSV